MYTLRVNISHIQEWNVGLSDRWTYYHYIYAIYNLC